MTKKKQLIPNQRRSNAKVSMQKQAKTQIEAQYEAMKQRAVQEMINARMTLMSVCIEFNQDFTKLWDEWISKRELKYAMMYLHLFLDHLRLNEKRNKTVETIRNEVDVQVKLVMEFKENKA